MDNFLLGLFFTNIKNIFNLGFIEHICRTQPPYAPYAYQFHYPCFLVRVRVKAPVETVDTIEEADEQ